MRILVVSDSHKRETNLYAVAQKVEPDKIFHLGDAEGREDEIAYMTGVPIECVRGNCDGWSSLPADVIMTVGDRVMLLTHGHLHGVNYGMEELVAYAKEKGADTVLYGHTHIPELAEIDGITIMNPGSISLPRQPGRVPSYGVINVREDGHCDLAIRYYDWE